MMWLLITGIVLWSVVHSFPALLSAQRARYLANNGMLYQGIFSLLIVLAIVLMVLGWRSSTPFPVYEPPLWGRHLTMLLMLLAIILFGAGHVRSVLCRYIRHPMLTAVVVWGVAHLLANGDIRSLVLFTGMVLWALLAMVMINRRDGTWDKPAATPIKWFSEVRLVGFSLMIYLLLVFFHPYLAGVPLIPQG